MFSLAFRRAHLPALVLMCAAFAVFPARAQDADTNGNLQALGMPPATDNAEPVTPAPADTPGGDMSDVLKKINNDAQTAPAPQPVEGDAATPPANGDLVSSPEARAKETATDVPVVPALPPQKQPDDNLFFDSESLVPAGQMGDSAPRKVDPALEPASKMIIVKKESGAGSKAAQLVAAGRAIQLRRYDSALEIYNNLYAKDPKDKNVMLGRAVALQKLGRTDDAAAAYEQLLNVDPKNTEAQINMLGLMGERYPAVALQRLRALGEQNPDDVRILAQEAVLEARLGHYDDAMSALGVAASLDENNAIHVYNMAVIADRAGRKDDAIRYYEKALEIDTVYGGSRTIPRDQVYDRLARLR